MMDVWGLNRRTVESLQAQSDVQRFTVEAAYLSLTANVVVAAIQEAALRGQIDATNQLIAINTRMLGILRQQLEAGFANRSDVAAQEAALAQVQATLPPLQKQLAVATRFADRAARPLPERGAVRTVHPGLPAIAPGSAGESAVAAHRAAPGRAPGGRADAFGERAGRVSPPPICFRISPSTPMAATPRCRLAGLLHPFNAFWLLSSNVTQTIFDAGTLLHLRREAEANYDQTGWTYRSVLIGALQNVADALHALQYDAEALTSGACTSSAPPRSASISPASRWRPATPTSSCCCVAQQTLSAIGHRGCPGQGQSPGRHGGIVSGAWRRLVESRRAAHRENPGSRFECSVHADRPARFVLSRDGDEGA